MNSVENVKNGSGESSGNPLGQRLKTVGITVGVIILCLVFLLPSDTQVNTLTNLETTPNSMNAVRYTLAKNDLAFESLPFIHVNYGADISRDRAQTWCKKELKTSLAPILCRKTLEMGRRLCKGDCWVGDGSDVLGYGTIAMIKTRPDTREAGSEKDKKKDVGLMSSFLCKNPRATIDPCKIRPNKRRMNGITRVWGFSYKGGYGCRSCNRDNVDQARIYEQRHVPGTFPIFAMNVSTTIGTDPMVASLVSALAKMLNVTERSVSGGAMVFLYNMTKNGASMYEVAIADSNNYTLSEELSLLTKVNDLLFKLLFQKKVTTALREVSPTGDVTVHNFTGVPTTRASVQWKKIQQQKGNESSATPSSGPSALFIGLVVAGTVLTACLIGCTAWYLCTKRRKNSQMMSEIQEAL